MIVHCRCDDNERLVLPRSIHAQKLTRCISIVVLEIRKCAEGKRDD